MKVKVKLLNGGIMPVKKTRGASCFDCYANESVFILQGKRKKVPLGFALELPEGYEAVIRPRSSGTINSIDTGIGTIDCDYRGEVSATIINNTESILEVQKGERICQMKIQESIFVELEQTEELSETERGDGGFGSTGRR